MFVDILLMPNMREKMTKCGLVRAVTSMSVTRTTFTYKCLISSFDVSAEWKQRLSILISHPGLGR